ncbi:MAG TPA: MASE1 domain-containing protein, partial [Terriglobales bacterium]
MSAKVLRQIQKVNRELWLVLSLFVIALVLNYLVAQHRMVLGFYCLPTIFSAYMFGRRHAVATASFSSLLVLLITYINPHVMSMDSEFANGKWFDLAVWAGTLVVTAYAMGTLNDRQKARERELRDTYYGVLTILRQFV